jgi:hypothetical protein
MNDATMDGKSAIRVAIGPKYEKGYHNKDQPILASAMTPTRPKTCTRDSEVPTKVADNLKLDNDKRPSAHEGDLG